MLRKPTDKLKRKPLERKQHNAADSCLNVHSKEEHKKPFAKVSFYLDLKDYFGIKSLTNDIKILGGTVDTFLSKDVKYLVTNRPNWKQHLRDATLDDGSLPSTPNSFSNTKSCLTNDSPNNTELPIVKIHSTAVVSRASALLEKARKSMTKGSSDVLQIARMWGVKVLSLSFLTTWIKKSKSQLHVKRTHNSKDVCKSKFSSTTSCTKWKFCNPFLKFEDVNGEYRPQYRQFREWPVLDLKAIHTRSPFSKVLQSKPNLKLEVLNPNSPSSSLASEGNNCNDDLSRPTKNITAQPINSNTSSKKTAPGTKPGFCEMCLIRYEDVYKHIKTMEHQKLLTSPDLYTLLDKRIAALPDIFSLAKMISKRSSSCSSTRTKTCSMGKTNSAAHSKENFSTPLSEPICRKRKKPTGTALQAKKVKALVPLISFSSADSTDNTSKRPALEVHHSTIPKNYNSLTRAQVDNVIGMELLHDSFNRKQHSAIKREALTPLDLNANMPGVQCNIQTSENEQKQVSLKIEKSESGKAHNAEQKEGIRLLRSTALRRNSVHPSSSKLASCPSFLPPCVNNILDSRQVKSSPSVSAFGKDRLGSPFGARRALNLDESFEADRNSTSLDASEKLKCLVDEFRFDDFDEIPMPNMPFVTTPMDVPCLEPVPNLPCLESILDLSLGEGLGWSKMPHLEKITNVSTLDVCTTNLGKSIDKIEVNENGNPMKACNNARQIRDISNKFHPQASNLSIGSIRNDLNSVFETALGIDIDKMKDITSKINESPLVRPFGVDKMGNYSTNDIEKQGIDEPLDYSMAKRKSTNSPGSTSNQANIVIDSSPIQSVASTVVNIISSPMEYNSSNTSHFINMPNDIETHQSLGSIPKFVFRRVRREMQTQWTISCIK